MPEHMTNEAPLARGRDHASRHAAAERITNRGKRLSQKNRVLLAVIGNRYSTSMVIASNAGMDRYTVARRLPDLLKEGFVRQVFGPNATDISWVDTEAGLNYARENLDYPLSSCESM